MLVFFIFIISTRYIQAQQEDHRNKSSRASIQAYPHSAFLSVMCINDFGDVYEPWHCGSSLVNQQILLTAGHCVTPCTATLDITINVGDVNKDRGLQRRLKEVFLHENYNDHTLEYDIALIKIRNPMKLTANIGRVAIMRRPPYNEPASVAGWGLTEKNKVYRYLIQLGQKVANQSFCKKRFGDMPKGTFCARSNKISIADYDSGSALVVRGYIQIGLVSYKSPGNDRLRNVIMYTDVGYFYDWIASSSRMLYCSQ